MRSAIHKCAYCATLLVLSLFAPAVANAEVRALLVGVGDYTSPLIPHLKGPENDVAAMQSLMKAEGATDVTVLRDHDVSRTSVEKAIHDLGARSKKGDWIVIYFSGHGAQAQEAVKGEEDDGLDEFLVLSGFDIEKPDPEQYIIDNDFYAWMSRYIPADVEVLHIADACHSGTLNRSIDMRNWQFTPRLAFSSKALNGQPVQLTARPAPQFNGVLPDGGQTRAAIASDRPDLPNVVYIGAAQDTQLALEASLPVQGAPSRGLLSYSLEHAFTTLGPDGKTLAADTDGDGAISVAELAAYTQSQTRTMTGQRQMPTAHFVPGQENIRLLKAQQPKIAAPPPPPPKPGIFATDPRAQALLAPETAWRAAKSAAEADFVWDYASGQVLRRSGDVVAERVTALEALRGVLEKWQAVDVLRPFISEANMHVVVGPEINGARYHRGAHVKIGVEGAAATAGKYLTVVNLASDGEVQLLYPLKEDGQGRLSGPAKSIMETEVVQPFGTDQVIAIATTERPDNLRRTLATVDGQRGAPVLAEAIKTELAKGPKQASLSIGELYSGAN